MKRAIIDCVILFAVGVTAYQLGARSQSVQIVLQGGDFLLKGSPHVRFVVTSADHNWINKRLPAPNFDGRCQDLRAPNVGWDSERTKFIELLR